MVSNEELKTLIRRAEAQGAIVEIGYDHRAATEGRQVIDTVAIVGLKGCGPHPMSAIGAAERLRGLLAGIDFEPYTQEQLAARVDEIAAGWTYDEAALRQAMCIEGIPQRLRDACRRNMTGKAQDTDHIRLQELAAAIRAPRAISFNTGRQYTAEGQKIEAKLVDVEVCTLFGVDLYVVDFNDTSRQINGRVKIEQFNQAAVMAAYDAGNYKSI
jgi:hypothetical protein